MKPICKLYDDNADVLCHGKEHFPQVFCLHFQSVRRFLSFPLQVEMLQLGNSVHQKRHIRPKLFFDFLGG